MMRIGVVRMSLKEHENRVPIYPEHMSWIGAELRKQLVFERDYGTDYGYSDEYFTQHGSGMASRAELFRRCDLLILPKPVRTDIEQMKPHQVLWGWTHCVQQHSITQPAIDNTVTLIAWEAMHNWSRSGEKLMHIFYKNNEIAGYAAVLH
ncbi:MAG: alanine dehydrogenase, partial [Planctomycetes bacterium]|nr:alanine dehydrogenase [Planctomycetota bacterium]